MSGQNQPHTKWLLVLSCFLQCLLFFREEDLWALVLLCLCYRGIVMSQLVYQYTEAEGCANDTQPKKPVHLYLWGQNQNR